MEQVKAYELLMNKPLGTHGPFQSVPIERQSDQIWEYIKAGLNLFKYRHVPKIELTLPIVQNICRIGHLKIGRE